LSILIYLQQYDSDLQAKIKEFKENSHKPTPPKRSNSQLNSGDSYFNNQIITDQKNKKSKHIFVSGTKTEDKKKGKSSKSSSSSSSSSNSKKKGLAFDHKEVNDQIERLFACLPAEEKIVKVYSSTMNKEVEVQVNHRDCVVSFSANNNEKKERGGAAIENDNKFPSVSINDKLMKAMFHSIYPNEEYEGEDKENFRIAIRNKLGNKRNNEKQFQNSEIFLKLDKKEKAMVMKIIMNRTEKRFGTGEVEDKEEPVEGSEGVERKGSFSSGEEEKGDSND